jgi:hypothetical protein
MLCVAFGIHSVQLTTYSDKITSRYSDQTTEGERSGVAAGAPSCARNHNGSERDLTYYAAREYKPFCGPRRQPTALTGRPRGRAASLEIQIKNP